MAFLQQKNFAQSRLTVAVDNDDTTFTVQDGSLFPSVGDFYVVCGNEICRCTARTGDDLTVVRATQDTVGAAHGIGSLVTRSVTRDDLRSFQFYRGPWSSRPAAGVPGRVYVSSDTPHECYDDGTAWNDRIFGHNVVPFDDTGMTWLNQGSATLVKDRGYGSLLLPSVAGLNIRGKYIAAPATPYNVIMFANWTQNNAAFFAAGLIWRDSGTGKLTFYGATNSGEYSIGKYNSATSFSASYSPAIQSKAGQNNAHGIWIRFLDDGTTRWFMKSLEGIYWNVITTVSRTDFHTPNQVGFAVNAEHGVGARMNIYSWYVGA